MRQTKGGSSSNKTTATKGEQGHLWGLQDLLHGRGNSGSIAVELHDKVDGQQQQPQQGSSSRGSSMPHSS
eukprot:12906640-Prorocentrum_lima.AAC.1